MTFYCLNSHERQPGGLYFEGLTLTRSAVWVKRLINLQSLCGPSDGAHVPSIAPPLVPQQNHPGASPPFLPSSLPSFFLFFYCTVFHWQCGTSSGGKQKNHRGDCWIMQTAPQKKPLSSVFGSILLYFSLLDSITVSSETALSHTLSLLSLTALLPSVDCVWLARIDPAHRQIWIGLKSMAAPLSCSCDRAQSPHRNMWAACCAADAAFKQSNWLFAPWDQPIRRSKMAKTN